MTPPEQPLFRGPVNCGRAPGRWRFAVLLTALLLGCLSHGGWLRGQQPDAESLDLGDVREQHVLIPMRDGKRLSAYLYFPPGDGPWPGVFEQRYASLRGKGTRLAAARLAREGFVVGLVNFRGTHLSEGTWVGYRALQWGGLQDGYDTCQWLAGQPWCTGKIGTFGSSQGGYAQNYLAVTQPPGLVCQYMTDTGLSLFHEGYRIGGTTRPERFQSLASVCRNPDDNLRLLEEWFRHPNYDAYWQAEDASLHFDRMNVPCFTIGSWYDFMNQGSIASFQGRQYQGGPRSRGRQQLVIGPWLHGRMNKGTHVGDLVYPEQAAWPEHEHMLRWFNHYLKGERNGVEQDPPVRYYVMGAVGEPGAAGNAWRTAEHFPPLSVETSLYLRAGGGLSEQRPTEPGSVTTYVNDPRQPMQIPGLAFPGARDARPFESQAEVRTFTTPPLDSPVEWTGRVQVELFVESTVRDTDFLVRISDVYPDGRSILIVDYPWRARYRDGFTQERLLEPGKVQRVAFPVGWLSQVFNRGHRIRVTVASSGAPLYEPNPQTGEPLTIAFPDRVAQARNTIHHGGQFASRILAPVVPDAAAEAAADVSDKPPGQPAERPSASPSPAPNAEAAGTDRLAAFRHKLQTGEPVTVVCFGDSVTGVYYHTGSRRAYTDMLGIALQRAFPQANLTLRNAGISGHTTTNGLERIERDVLAHKPDLVTVMFGLNDMTRVPLSDYRRNLRTIIERCREAGAEVVLATPNNVTSTPARPTDKLIQYCDVVRQVGRESGVAVCDCYSQLEALRQRDAWGWRLLMSDAIHPNMDGHKRMAEQLARSIGGRSVFLRDVPIPKPSIPRTTEILRGGQTLKVLAMPPLDEAIVPAIRRLFPDADLQVTAWPTEGRSLAELEQDARHRVRSSRPDLVLIGVPREAKAEGDEQFAGSFAWIMNWSLNFAPPTWDCVVVHPEVFTPRAAGSADTREWFGEDRDRLIRRLVAAQDLPLIDRSGSANEDVSAILEAWFRREIPPRDE